MLNHICIFITFFLESFKGQTYRCHPSMSNSWFLYQKTNRFHVAVGLCSGENVSVTCKLHLKWAFLL